MVQAHVLRVDHIGIAALACGNEITQRGLHAALRVERDSCYMRHSLILINAGPTVRICGCCATIA